MNIKMFRGAASDSFPQKWDIGICGEALDARGRAATEFLNGTCRNVESLSYNPDANNLTFCGADHDPTRFVFKNVTENQSVVLEATTLGFVEIALCCKALKLKGCAKISILYLEPLSYFARNPSDLLKGRDFDLTDEVRTYTGVPGWTRRVSENSSRIVFLLGFEGQRLAQAIEQLPLNRRKCSVVFGVPAYRPGWELDAFSNNIAALKEARFSGGVEFCAADNPLAVVNLLNTSRSNGDMFVVPIGTKPHGIGAAIFAAMKSDVGLFYDNPFRRKGRSDNIGAWHLFEVSF